MESLLIAVLLVFLVLFLADRLGGRLGKYADGFWIVVVVLVILWLVRGTPGI